MTHHEPIRTLEWRDDACSLLDQTRLPGTESYVRCTNHRDMVDHIQSLVVRGAPALGVAGGYGAALAAREALELPMAERAEFFRSALERLAAARPTAVNLQWAIRRMQALWAESLIDGALAARVLEEAIAIQREDQDFNRRIAENGAALLAKGKYITYCNAGHLATGGGGTACGVLYEGFRRGLVEHVYTCETRPVLQGLRLTAWELARHGVPFTVICDNMAASVMRAEKIAGVIVGADRIAANGDVANKVGTYALALAAKHHGIPFYVAAPSSTFDPKIPTGESIPIEQRSPDEVLSVLGENRHPFEVRVHNPAFDVTPRSLVTAIISEGIQ